MQPQRQQVITPRLVRQLFSFYLSDLTIALWNPYRHSFFEKYSLTLNALNKKNDGTGSSSQEIQRASVNSVLRATGIKIFNSMKRSF
jgi:hypothetical protein